MKTAAITIDSWKYKTFKRILKKNAFQFEKVDPPDIPIIILRVKTNDLETLKAVVEKCQHECQQQSHNGGVH